jgi:hypothetical protein
VKAAPMLTLVQYAAIDSFWMLENASFARMVTTSTRGIRNARHVLQTV